MLIFAGVLLLVLTFSPVLRGVGRFLAAVENSDAGPADMIVPLGGGSPFRAMEATGLFHQRMAPKVFVPKPAEGPNIREMEALGFTVPGTQKMVFQTLQRLQVPAAAVILSHDTTSNTEEELESVGRYALAAGHRRVILVTSWYHARRVRLIWKARFKSGPEAAIRILSAELASKEGIDPSSWWRSKRARQIVFHEYLGILTFLLRHPLAFRSA